MPAILISLLVKYLAPFLISKVLPELLKSHGIPKDELIKMHEKAEERRRNESGFK